MKTIALASPCVLVVLAAMEVQAADAPAVSAETTTALPASPEKRIASAIRFEPNRGQAERSVRFISRGGGQVVFLRDREAVVALGGQRRPGAGPGNEAQAASPDAFRLRWVGADCEPELRGRGELPGRVHYLRGQDPRGWHTDIPTYASVSYEDLYPGISLVFHAVEGQLQYDFIVEPGADPTAIRLRVDGFAWQEASPTAEIGPGGELTVCMKGYEAHWSSPLIYQDSSDGPVVVDGGYVRTGESEFSFRLGAYDLDRRLVIDPFLVYGTYLGGGDLDGISDLAIDTEGHAYVTGTTVSSQFPTVDPFQPNQNNRDVFVSKFSPSGETLLYSTYLGGGEGDFGQGIAVDTLGSAYVVGMTNSGNFPTLNAFQDSKANDEDAFVTKLDASGSALAYSTYLGGGRDDLASAVAVDDAGSAYVTGWTYSDNFPMQNAFQDSRRDDQEAFVTKLGPAGSTLTYSTYLGGGDDDLASSIAIDVDGNAVVVGSTRSDNFPTASAFQDRRGGGFDSFVTKLDSEGSSPVFSTYLGGGEDDEGMAVAVDATANVYVAGGTKSDRFPTVGALQSKQKGGEDAFVSVFNAAGSSLTYSTFLGGGSAENATSVAVGPEGRIFVAGITTSSNYPVQDAPISKVRGGQDGFLSVLEPLGDAFLYTGYVGGGGLDSASAVVVDSEGNAYVAGTTRSSNLALRRAFQESLRGDEDGFLIKVSQETARGMSVTRIKGPKSIKLSDKKPSLTKRIKVRIENRGGAEEVIPDLGALEALVVLTVETMGDCPEVTPVLIPPKKGFPLTIVSRKSLDVSFEATFDCANDAAKSSKKDPDHEDYRLLATVDLSALGGNPDDVPEDDECPRDPIPDLIDPLGKLKEKGCGAKKADKTLGGDILIDVVVK